MELLKQGLGVREVARRLRAAAGSVSRWAKEWEKTDEAGLKAKPASGRPKKLTARQRDRLLKLLLQGAMANGYPNELWTLKRIASVIRKRFSVHYHPSHVWKLLQSCGWSCQFRCQRNARFSATRKPSRTGSGTSGRQ